MWRNILIFIATITLAIVGVYFISDVLSTDAFVVDSVSDVVSNNYSREDFYTEYQALVVSNEETGNVGAMSNSIIDEYNNDNNHVSESVVINTAPIDEEFTTFVTEGSLDFSNVNSQNLSNDKQEAFRAVYYTLHNAGFSDIIIAGVLGSVCNEGNIAHFEIIRYGDSGGHDNYKENVWKGPYYQYFPHKDTNNEGPDHEYANSYSDKQAWKIKDFTCEELKQMLNVGVDEKVMIFGFGVSQSTYYNKHQVYMDVIDEYCSQYNIQENTVIDKDMAMQLEAMYIRSRVEVIMPNDEDYKKEGIYLKKEKRGWDCDDIISGVSTSKSEVNSSEELQNVCRAATFWFVEEEACSGATKPVAITRAANAVECYQAIKNYQSNR